MAALIGFTPGMQSTGLPGDYDVEQKELDRRRAMIKALMGGPKIQGKMVGNHYVPAGGLAALANALDPVMESYFQKDITEQEQNLAKRRSEAAQEWMANPPTGTPAREAQPGWTDIPGRAAIEEPPEELGGGPGAPEIAAIPGREPVAAEPAKPVTQAQLAEYFSRGLGISPLTNEIAKAGVAKMIAGPQLAIETAFDPKTGREVKYIVDKRTMQKVGELGGQKAEEKTSGEKDTNYLANLYKVSPQVAAQTAFGLNKPQVIPEKGGLSIVDVGAEGGLYPPRGQPGYPGLPNTADGKQQSIAPNARFGPTEVSIIQTDAAKGAAGTPVAGSIYREQAPNPNVKTIVPGVGPGERLEEKVTELSKELIKSLAPNVIDAGQPIAELLAKYPRGDLPGVGGLMNDPTVRGIVKIFKPEVGPVSQAINTWQNMLMQMASGVAVTDPEAARKMREIGQTTFDSEDDFRNAYHAINDLMEKKVQRITDPYHPDVKDTYRNRISEEKIKRAAEKAAGAAPAAAKTVKKQAMGADGKMHHLYTDGTTD